MYKVSKKFDFAQNEQLLRLKTEAVTHRCRRAEEMERHSQRPSSLPVASKLDRAIPNATDRNRLAEVTSEMQLNR